MTHSARLCVEASQFAGIDGHCLKMNSISPYALSYQIIHFTVFDGHRKAQATRIHTPINTHRPVWGNNLVATFPSLCRLLVWLTGLDLSVAAAAAAGTGRWSLCWPSDHGKMTPTCPQHGQGCPSRDVTRIGVGTGPGRSRGECGSESGRVWVGFGALGRSRSEPW